MVVSKHLTHFCYPIKPVLCQHLNSHLAYAGIPPESSKVSAMNFQVGYQNMLRANSDADELLA